MSNVNPTSRYSEEDLAMFKKIIEEKLEKARKQMASIEDQIQGLSESMEEEVDWIDDSSNHERLELLQTMLFRQKKHIIDLENALQRIRNKSYGICSVTGKLIDKRRLLAVPTTTKSLAAKTGTPPPPPKDDEEEDEDEKKVVPKKKKEEYKPKVITKIIRKPVAPKPPIEDDDDDDLDDLDLIDDGLDNLDDDVDVDPDSLSDEVYD